MNEEKQTPSRITITVDVEFGSDNEQERKRIERQVRELFSGNVREIKVEITPLEE